MCGFYKFKDTTRISRYKLASIAGLKQGGRHHKPVSYTHLDVYKRQRLNKMKPNKKVNEKETNKV